MAGSVANMAGQIRGSAKPLDIQALACSNWMLHYGTASEELREEIALLANMLANESSLWATCCAIMACRLVALDKCPGI
eukprot:1193271-Ditylum_brightwellii.AAC.2